MAAEPGPVEVGVAGRSVRPVDDAAHLVTFVHQDVEWVKVEVEEPVALGRPVRAAGCDQTGRRRQYGPARTSARMAWWAST